MQTSSIFPADQLWIRANLITAAKDNALEIKKNAALAVADGKISWIGTVKELPHTPKKCAKKVHDVKGKWITPGLIDCHSHLIYAGNRISEFELRLQGANYKDIARAGGGIRATVEATRAASFEELYEYSRSRLMALMVEGVTTIEIKSGYALDLANELKILRVARRLGEELPITVRTTFLGAHALPEEYAGRADAYIDFLCEEVLPAAKKENLIDAVDAFCETIAFTPKQVAKLFDAAKAYKLPVKIHAEQLSNFGGAGLAARYQALSADHLEYVAQENIAAMAKSGTVAVLLPGPFYYLRETRQPPIDVFRQYKVPMAVATDCNPGTSPITSLLLMLNMACTLFHMTPEEALLGVTRHAAKALGLSKTHGSLEVGKVADFVIWNISEPAELAYYLGFNPCVTVVKNGQPHHYGKKFSIGSIAKN